MAAIAASLAQRGVGELALFDAAPGRAAEVAARVRQEFPVDVRTPAQPDPAGYDLVINASPLGLKAGDPLPFDVARLDAGAAVVDILMKNQPTPLLRTCHARGITAHPASRCWCSRCPSTFPSSASMTSPGRCRPTLPTCGRWCSPSNPFQTRQTQETT